MTMHFITSITSGGGILAFAIYMVLIIVSVSILFHNPDKCAYLHILCVALYCMFDLALYTVCTYLHIDN